MIKFNSSKQPRWRVGNERNVRYKHDVIYLQSLYVVYIFNFIKYKLNRPSE